MGSGSRRRLRGFSIRVGKSVLFFSLYEKGVFLILVVGWLEKGRTLGVLADKNALIQYDHLPKLQVLLPSQGIGHVHEEIWG